MMHRPATGLYQESIDDQNHHQLRLRVIRIGVGRGRSGQQKKQRQEDSNTLLHLDRVNGKYCREVAASAFPQEDAKMQSND